MDKREIRSSMRRLNKALDAVSRERLSRDIFKCVELLPHFATARCVALFASLSDEPDTREVLGRWHERGLKVALPRVEGDTMRFFHYAPRTMAAGAFGIEEPGEDAALCEVGEIDLIVVPGVAFTAAGDRMGRGRGYYDKYLSQSGVRALKVGVCYPHQIVDSLPVEEHDVKMDRVIYGR